ncbi:aldehyde dehydrogenase family protein, partial [Pedobacter petrophilus]
FCFFQATTLGVNLKLAKGGQIYWYMHIDHRTWINTLFELDPMMPFGGYKQSGLGRELGAESIDAYTQIKTVVVRY